MNGNDRFLNVNDAHLRVTGGNVHASSFNLDQISITTTSTTSSTIDFLNETKAFNARSNIEVGTANLFVDTTTSNVGIHTSSPEYALDVHGPANVSVLTAASNVGILTTSPEYALDVHGTANVGVLTANTITGSGGTLLLGSHIIPTQHQQFDIGSAEYKIRHLYLSNNSLWIGDDSKISVVDGKMKFLKRNKNIVPSGTLALEGNEAAALEHAQNSNPGLGLTNINQMKLEHWLAYTKTLPGGEDKDIKDIFTTDTSNYESVTASEAFKEYDDTNIYSVNKLRLGSAAAADATLDVVGTIKATNDLTVNTDTFHVDATNNRVGILTTSPEHALDVYGTANVGVLTATSFVTNSTFKRLADSNGQTIKMSKYIATASNMKIATGLYTGTAYQWVSIRVKFTRLDKHTQTVQFDYLGTGGNSTVKNPIVIGDSPGNGQDNEVVVYNKTSTGEYEIYLQIDSATTIDVEIYHKGSTIDEHYTTLTTANSGAIDETGLTMVYNSGTHADFSLRDKNAIISDDAIYDNLYNYGDTQSIFIDRGIAGGTAGTVTADTTYDPPPGVVGDVVCRFYNSTSSTEAVTNNFSPPGLTCSANDVFTFGVWALATQGMGMEFFINPAYTGGAAVGWQVIGDGKWRFYQKSVTVASGASNTNAFFRVDNNTPGATVYLTGASIRKNPTSGVILPYTPRYSPNSGKGTVLATRTLIAKEAAIKTLTGPLSPLSIYTGSTSTAALSFDRYATGNYRTDIYQNTYGPDFRVGYGSHAPATVLTLERFSNGSKLACVGDAINPILRLRTTKGGDAWGTTSSDQYGKLQWWGNDWEMNGGVGAQMAAITVGTTDVYPGAMQMRFFVGSPTFVNGAWNNNYVGYLSTSQVDNITFTGQHRNFIDGIPATEYTDYEGLIVSANKNKYYDVDKNVKTGVNAIQISQSLPLVSLSTKEKDKACFGVISGSEDPDTREYSQGSYVSVCEKQNGDRRAFINSVGEGAIWVTNINGPLESGDYITTSNVAGYGQKQDSDSLKNYTVAKITMDCDFEPVTQPVQIIKKEMGDVNYWVKTIYESITEEEYSNLTDEKRRIVEGDYQKITIEESKTEQEGYELDVRQELVNILDEHGQIQWEDHPTETEKAYKIRYLDADGNITNETNAVHKAAFVGCTYHCG